MAISGTGAYGNQPQVSFVRDRQRQAVTFQGWRGGEFGIQEPGQAEGYTQGNTQAQLNPFIAQSVAGQRFTSNNMVVYPSGLIGPRAGMKLIATPGLPGGTIQGMGPAQPASGVGPWFWVSIANLIYRVDIGMGTVTAAYTVGTGPAPTFTSPVAMGGSTSKNALSQLASQGETSLLAVNHTISQVNRTAFGGIAPSSVMGNYKARLVTGKGGPGPTFYFSDVSGLSWTLTNYYDLSTTSSITMMRPFRDGLLIGTDTGEMWYLTGVLGSAANLRQLSRGGAPAGEPRGLVLDDNICWYMKYGANYVSSFNGAVHTDYKYLPFMGPVVNDDTGLVVNARMIELPSVGTNDWMVVSGQAGTESAARMMLYTNGIFTYHTFGFPMSAWGLSVRANSGLSQGQAGTYVVLTNGASYYKWQPNLGRPAFVSDPDAQPGDGTTFPVISNLSTPEWWDLQGHEVRVQEVIIDYVGWNTGNVDFPTNVMTVSVDALHRWGNVATTVGAAQTVVNEPVTNFSTTGTTRRVVFSADAGLGFGGGFQVKVNIFGGLAIRSITAVMSVDSRRP